MPQPNNPPSPAVMRLVFIGLIMGLIGFSVVAIAIAPVGDASVNGGILLIALGALVVTELIIAPVVGRVFRTQLRKALTQPTADGSPPSAAIDVLMHSRLVFGAMAEGMGMFGSVIFLLVANPTALAAPALALVVLLALYPTDARIRQTMESAKLQEPLR